MKLENTGKTLSILSFPCTSLMGVKTDELVHSTELQAKGMKVVAVRTDAAASVSMMDLSVEAEAFGAEVRFSPDEVPSVIGAVVGSPEDAVQTADFPLIYHNCGNNTIKQAGSIFGIGAAGYHFGNAISMKEMLAIAPKDAWIMGNVDPAGALANGTPESVRAATLKPMEECCPDNPNFIVSSGCDIPPHAPWANLDAFFAAAAEWQERM